LLLPLTFEEALGLFVRISFFYGFSSDDESSSLESEDETTGFFSTFFFSYTGA
jgi:hypothetical protein